jgi:hypothetical protein
MSMCIDIAKWQSTKRDILYSKTRRWLCHCLLASLSVGIVGGGVGVEPHSNSFLNLPSYGNSAMLGD